MRKSMAQQLADFEVMKKALMRDLQSRCERVVELEMSLDETREHYNNVLRTSNNKAQQKKMAFLERNLEQLTNVQKQVRGPPNDDAWPRSRFAYLHFFSSLIKTHRSRRKWPWLNAS